MKNKFLFLSLGILPTVIAPISMVSCENKQDQAKKKLEEFISKMKTYLTSNGEISDGIKNTLNTTISAMETLLKNSDFSNMTSQAADELIKSIEASIKMIEESLNIKL
ncbi:Uncharacterised protein [Metamycoplasma cloacale]|uniref:Uncharacterized protein n=1 Tax=Metamycoplasma cloacale TaxID=92401 RepID=A0A2Z4LMA3_9BACT|nr:hypothetical protein [Metamycoplasma cloacale]AWX42608.1 hypothetical protein DK849_00720 [Metamycoplasma cloacale]VEU79646.1 Uncharacterised protein [Metamycoplasma cloacale]